MDTILIKAVDEYTDDHPIVMIDVSGSTSGSIIIKEKQIAQDILTNKNIKICNLICWSGSESHVYPNINASDLATFDTKNEQFGGTDLSWAFYILPKEWYEGKKCTEIYIITDGEIYGDDYIFKNQITNLILNNLDNRIKIHSIAVESGSNNYNEVSNLNAGTRFYKILQEQKLMNHISSFITYNKYHITPFINIQKHDVPEGYIPFRDSCFSIMDTNKFIKFLRKDILLIKDDKEKLDRLSHHLAYTVHHLVASKPSKIKHDIVDMFCNLFRGTVNYDGIIEILAHEIYSHETGTSSSYVDYRNNRKNLFNISQMNLYKNTKKSITYNKYHKFMTFPLKNKDGVYVTYKLAGKKVTCDVRMRDKTFVNGGMEVGNYTIPVLPTKTIIRNEVINQCLRQYVRAIMSNMYDLYPSDDTILYLFLTLVLKVYLSDVSDETKQSFNNLARVMLNRVRYQTKVKEMDHLLEGNPPLPVLDDFCKMKSILQYCVDTYDMGNIQPYTLWYGIIIAIGDPQLMINQLKYCKNDIKQDFPEIVNIINELPKLLKKDKFKDIIVGNTSLDDIEYTCYFTLDNTSETGGLKFVPHEIANGIVCAPRYVISPDIIEEINTLRNGEIMCPICNANFTTTSLENIPPKSILENNESGIELHTFDTILFNNKKHETVDTNELMKVSKVLYDIDDLDFSVSSYQLKGNLIVNHNLGQTFLINKTNEAFIEALNKDHKFLTTIDMNNVCVAGGFGKSILLKQRVQDIDLFLYGLEDVKAYRNRTCKLVNDIEEYMKNTINNVVFVILYKANNHVLELLCLEYTEENMNDKIIFSDIVKDEKNYKLHHKIQIILLKNDNILHLLNTFDLAASQVVFDKSVYMTNNAYNAYKYMVNMVDESKHTDIFHVRICKYYKYGFAMAFPEYKLSRKISNIDKIVFSGDTYEITPIFTSNNTITASAVKSTPGKKTIFCNTGGKYKKGRKMYTSYGNKTIGTTARYIMMINGQINGMSQSLCDLQPSVSGLPQTPEKDVVVDNTKNPTDKIFYKVWLGTNKINIEEYENGTCNKIKFITSFEH
uniref:von willebrand factor type A domain protein n=1 Tax=Mimivirus LCMiAC01 TaxID=2506608 RepID=A0A481YZK4_9VIRU|nr:MAG: von willebrand factor type A domain protein [Mimivirus LCMiAC01]